MLTVDQDTLSGTAGNDTFVAGQAQDGAGTLIDTLQSADSINGGAGTDTLKITFDGDTEGTVMPTLTSVENVVVRLVDSGNDIDLANASGVTSFTLENSGGEYLYLDNAGAISTYTMQNNTADAGIEIDSPTATAITLNLTNTGNLDNSDQSWIDFGYGNAPKATSLTINATDSYVWVGDDLDANTLKAVTINATGENSLDLDFGYNSIETLTVTGTGSVDLSDETLSTVKTVAAAANSGGLTAVFSTTPTAIATGAGEDDITVGALAANASIDLGAGDDTLTTGALAAAKTFTIAAGDGNDTVDLTGASAAAVIALTGGAGDDIVKVGANLDVFASTSTLNGGDGTNTIGITDGADLTTTTGAMLSNFQVLEVAGGTGIYDMSKVSGLKDVTLTGADLGGAITIDKAAAGASVTVTSDASTDLAVTSGITFDLKDASGSADVATFNLNAVDGDDDGVAEGNITLTAITLADDANNKGIETIKLVSDAVADADDADTNGVDESLTAPDYTNTVTTLAGTSLNKVLDVTANASLTITTVNATLTALGSIKVAGAGDFTITNTLNALTKLTSVDASASTGDVTIDASANTLAINYKGSEGVDTFTAGTLGGVIYTGKGADVVDLGASNTTTGVASAADVIVLKAATDSQIVDTSKDGKFTLSDGGFDAITGFETVTLADSATTADKLDVTTLAFSGYAKGVVDVSALVTATSTDLTSVAHLFADAGGDRGVAYSVVGSDTYVFVDVNHDGNFTAAADLVVELVGVSGLGTGSTDVAF